MEDAIFSNVFLPKHHAWRAGASSAVLHVLLFAALPQMVTMLTPLPDFEWNRYEVKPLNLRVPLYFAEMSKPVPEQNPRRRGEGKAVVEQASPSAARMPLPRVDLPASAVRKNAETVLLQPNVPMPNIQLSQMPALAFWARQTPEPKLAKPFVQPGRTEQPASPAQLDAPPSLAVSNRQPRLSDLNVAALPPVNKPALPVQPSSTAPVRMPKVFNPPEEKQATSIDAGQGEAANVIAFGAVPAPDKIVTVPPVTQAPSFGSENSPVADRPAPRNDKAALAHSAPNPNANGSGSGDGKADASAKDAAHARKSDSAKAGATTGGASGSSTGSAAAAATAGVRAPEDSRTDEGKSSVARNITAGMRSVSGAQVQQAMVNEASTVRPSAPPAAGNSSANSGTRFVLPRDGRFSFVVTGSSESYPEARGVLGGKIVYTVSVRVGAPKEWILQYCLPKDAERSLGLRSTSTPLEAPYPFVMVRPSIHSEIDIRRLVIHGFVTQTGKLEQLSYVSDVDFPEKQLLLASLAQWEFRPASRDGQPTAVEVLLIIPREAV